MPRKMFMRGSMTPEDFVNAFVARGILCRVDLRARAEQGLDDGGVLRSEFVDGCPNSGTQDGAAVGVSRFDRRVVPDQESYDFQLPSICGPLKRIQPRADSAGGMDASREEILRHLRAAKETRAGERLGQR